jgi:hypothetical protein
MLSEDFNATRHEERISLLAFIDPGPLEGRCEMHERIYVTVDRIAA